MYSIDNKTYFCTRCLTHFNHERYLKIHENMCPNQIEPGNLIDALKTTGGYSREIRRRWLEKAIRYNKKWESELMEMKKTEDKKRYHDDDQPEVPDY